MFAVKGATTVEYYCPNGHETLPDLLPPDPADRDLLGLADHAMRFCHICGAPIEVRQVIYDAAICADCNKSVNPEWNYCPYCGQGREAKDGS